MIVTTRDGHVLNHTLGLHQTKLELECPICRDLTKGRWTCLRCGQRNAVKKQRCCSCGRERNE